MNYGLDGESVNVRPLMTAGPGTGNASIRFPP